VLVPFHKVQLVASCKVKVKEASLQFRKYDKVYFIPEKVDGVPVFNETKVYSTSIYATYGISDRCGSSITICTQKVMQQIRF
jgi:hypothetical protein